MFEFRDPSLVVTFDNPVTTPVPESSSFGLILGFVGLGFLGMRRRIR